MPAEPEIPPRRAPRRDALRNDRLVVEAARAVFAEQGPRASMEDIARRAGVGVGTIYRRFPGKEALLDAIAELFVAELDRAATEALAEEDAGRALDAFLEFVGTFNAEKRRYAAALVERVAEESTSAGILEKVGRLTRNAVAAGALAPGVREADIAALLVALREVVASSEGDEGWRRFLRIHLAGLRSTS